MDRERGREREGEREMDRERPRACSVPEPFALGLLRWLCFKH